MPQAVSIVISNNETKILTECLYCLMMLTQCCYVLTRISTAQSVQLGTKLAHYLPRSQIINFKLEVHFLSSY
jgi:hypothetical protein